MMLKCITKERHNAQFAFRMHGNPGSDYGRNRRSLIPGTFDGIGLKLRRATVEQSQSNFRKFPCLEIPARNVSERS